MAKTRPEEFMRVWEEYIPQMNDEDIDRWLSETSSQHPNENMRWLYDRLLAEKVK